MPTDKCCELNVKAIEVVLVGYEADAKGYSSGINKLTLKEM